MTTQHKTIDELKEKFEDGDRPIGEDFARLLDSCHNTYQDTDVNITGELTVDDRVNLTGYTTVDDSVMIAKNLTANGTVVFKSSMNVSGMSTLSDLLIVNKLTVNDTVSFKKDVSVDSNVLLRRSLEVLDDISTQNINTKTLTCEENITGGGDISISGDLTAGKTHINGDLVSVGNVSLASADHLTTIRGNVVAEENATFVGNVLVKGDLRVDGNAYLSAGSDGVIKVGDDESDVVDLIAAIESDIIPVTSGARNIGSQERKWATGHIENMYVNFVNGRNPDTDGDLLDSIAGQVADWTSTKTTVQTFSSSWEESADIDAVHTEVQAISQGVAGWEETKSVVQANSSDWSIVRSNLSELDDVDTTGVQHNSILKYDQSAGWVIGTDNYGSTGSSPLSTFAGLTDTPVTYTGAAGKYVSVNSSEDGLEYIELDISDITNAVAINSGNWNDTYTHVGHGLNNWSSTYNTVKATSANWNSTYNTVNTTSADWRSTHTSVNGASANWNSVYNHIQSISGEGLALLDSNGKLVVDQIPELSITRVHTANNPSDVEQLSPTTGIQPGDVVVVASTHDNLISLVENPTGVYSNGDYFGYAKLSIPDGLVQTVNGKPGPSVILNPDDIDDASTAHKFVSQQNIDDIYDTRSAVVNTSGDWNDARSAVVNTSGDWNDARTTVQTFSSSWEESADIDALKNDVETDVQFLSGHISNVTTTSGDWNDARTTVQTFSSSWEESADIDAVAADVTVLGSVSADWVVSTGDTMTGDLKLDGAELEVGGNITVAGDVIHQNDTGTRISFNEDIITLEANSQEYITIDGTAPTPDTVIINNPASTAIHFKIKSVDNANAIYVDGQTGKTGIGLSNFAGLDDLNCWVDGGLGIQTGNVTLNNGSIEVKLGDVSVNDGNLNVTGDVSTTGEMTSAGVPLHDIFTTTADVNGDFTVSGSVTASGDMTISGNQQSNNVTANNITATGSFQTKDNTGATRAGVTKDINIGGHVLHIINGLIVDVTDEV